MRHYYSNNVYGHWYIISIFKQYFHQFLKTIKLLCFHEQEKWVKDYKHNAEEDMHLRG